MKQNVGDACPGPGTTPQSIWDLKSSLPRNIANTPSVHEVATGVVPRARAQISVLQFLCICLVLLRTSMAVSQTTAGLKAEIALWHDFRLRILAWLLTNAGCHVSHVAWPSKLREQNLWI